MRIRIQRKFIAVFSLSQMLAPLAEGMIDGRRTWKAPKIKAELKMNCACRVQKRPLLQFPEDFPRYQAQGKIKFKPVN
jgi:hypothetical protein